METAIFGALGNLLRKSALLSSQDLAEFLTRGMQTKSGVEVTRTSALQVSTVLACARVLADGVAQVPLKLHQASGDNVRVAEEHPLHNVLSLQVNPHMTSYAWREQVMFHLCLSNKHYAFINRIGPSVRELWPLDPDAVEMKVNPDRTFYFKLRLEDGGEQIIQSSDMLYISGPTWDGRIPLDILAMAKEAIALAIAAEASASSLYANGIRPSGVYSVDGTLSKNQYDGLRKHLAAMYSGTLNTSAPMVLDRSAKWVPSAMTSVDAQHYEMRRLQIEEICRVYRVMPIMVGHADKVATYASAEQMFIAHVVHTLSPWYARFEQAFATQLLTEQERAAKLYVKFSPNGLMRGASGDRSSFYSRALGAGGGKPWLTQDDVRKLEEMNPMGGAAGELASQGSQQNPPP